jgi:hypothetical protein
MHGERDTDTASAFIYGKRDHCSTVNMMAQSIVISNGSLLLLF